VIRRIYGAINALGIIVAVVIGGLVLLILAQVVPTRYALLSGAVLWGVAYGAAILLAYHDRKYRPAPVRRPHRDVAERIGEISTAVLAIGTLALVPALIVITVWAALQK
jgi:hypothetical protein